MKINNYKKSWKISGLEEGIHSIQILNTRGKPVLKRPFVFYGTGIIFKDDVLIDWKGYKVLIDLKEVGKVGRASRRK